MSEYMNFEAAYLRWRGVLDKLGYAPDSVFSDVQITLDEPTTKAPATAWWLRQNAILRAQGLTQHLNAFPHTQGAIHYNKLNLTTQKSASIIWEMRNQPKCMFAYLMCTSLFNRLFAVSSKYPLETWGKRAMPAHFYKLCDEFVFECGHKFATHWTHFNSTIMPHKLEDDKVISSEYDLIDFLAREHSEIFRLWQVTRITFKQNCPAPA